MAPRAKKTRTELGGTASPLATETAEPEIGEIFTPAQWAQIENGEYPTAAQGEAEPEPEPEPEP